MLVESFIKETVELQGFRVVTAQKTGYGLEAELATDRLYAPRCAACGRPARYRDTRAVHRFRHVPLWEINVYLTLPLAGCTVTTVAVSMSR